MASSSHRPREPLPSELNTSGGSLAFLEVGKDKLTVKYNGPAQHDNDVGSIQANHPVPCRQLLYYFEVTIKEASGGSITLGFSDRNFKQGRHPGYEPHSYGFRGDTGRKHHSSLPTRGEEYGPAFGPGDVVGAGIHLTRHEIFFTKNGQHLGTAFRNITGHPLYPTIGLHSQGACVEANFGRRPFQYDVAAMAESERKQQAEAMDSTLVSAGEVHQLVRNYLLHFGYAESLAAFDAAAGMSAAGAEAAARHTAGGGGGEQGPAAAAANGAAAPNGSSGGAASAGQEAAALSLLPLRAQLRRLLMAGDTAGVRQLLLSHAPVLLAPTSPAAAFGSGSPGGSMGSTEGAASGGTGSFEMQFHLACQQYIELIRAGDVAGALSYAEGTLSALRGASPQHDAVLRDVVALIAYQQPDQSPLAHLLAPAQREATADVLNAGLLRSRAPPGSREPQAALEALLQQLAAVHAELHEMAGGHGPEFDLSDHLPQLSVSGGGAAGRQGAPQQPQQQAEQQQEPEPMAE